MKLVLLLTIFSVLGAVLCDTHEQQKDYAEVLIDNIEQFAEDAKDLIKNTDATKEKGANAILVHANALNFDIHYVLDVMQHLASQYKEESASLQEVVFKLNNITNDLENSFQDRVGILKFKLQRSVQNIVKEARSLEQIVRDNQNDLYRSSVLRILDDLVNSVQTLFFRAAVRAAPIKIVLKLYLQVSRRAINLLIYLLNSEDENIQKDIVQYSSKFSSAISNMANLLKDLTSDYPTNNEDDVKEIIYSLGKICYDNEELLYNENSFNVINEQFRRNVENLFEQLSKMIDAGFSDNGIFVKDETLIYIVFPEMYAQSYKLVRLLEKTYQNQFNARSN